MNMNMLIQLVGITLSILLLSPYPQCSGTAPDCDGQAVYLKQIEDLKKTIIDLQNAKQLLETTNKKDSDLNTSPTNMKQVTLNVGGEKFVTTWSTLTRINNSYFTSLLSNNSWKQQLDGKGRIFIDRNGELFTYILDYLRTGEIDFPELDLYRPRVIREAEFYNLTTLALNLRKPSKNLDSKVNTPTKEMKEMQVNVLNVFNKCLTDSINRLKEGVEQSKETLVALNTTNPTLPLLFTNAGTLLNAGQQAKLNEFYGDLNQRWKLLYKASRDGFSASTFHQLCDDKGGTMTIIKSRGGWLFGGFTAQSWKSSTSNYEFKNDPQAFIFTLTNPHNIPSTKFIIKDQKRAICAFRLWGPRFGGGADIHVDGNSNITSNSYTTFPTSYMDTTSKGKTLFTGSLHFTTADIEVYALLK